MASIYTPLLNTPQEIRLLNLEPQFGNPVAAIKIRLEPANLWHAGTYTCLSYRWGDTAEMKSIFVDGKEFLVRRNLYDALKRLRLRDEPRRLWIDAICINQDDAAERSAQVAVMQYIFQNAADVIAWVGEAEGGSHGRPVTQRAADFVRELSFRGAKIAKGGGNLEVDADDETARWIKFVTPPGWVGSPWVDFLALVERPWFSRIWIIQEVAVAKAVTVWCGRHRWDWVDFLRGTILIREHAFVIMGCAAPRWFRSHDPERWRFMFDEGIGWRLMEAITNISSIVTLNARQHFRRRNFESLQEELGGTNRSDTSSRLDTRDNSFEKFRLQSTWKLRTNPSHEDYLEKRQTFYEMVKRFRRFEATDPRDKIYALMGIADSVQNVSDAEHGIMPAISYSPDVEIFDVTWHLISSEIVHHQKLDFLVDACRIRRPEGFPSWMPLWYDYEMHQPSFALPLEAAEQSPHITYRAGTSFKILATPVKITKTLYLGAVCFSPIIKIGEVYNRDLTEGDETIFLQKWAWMLGIRTRSVYRLLANLKDANRVSPQEAEKTLCEYIKGASTEKRGCHRRFFGTVLASASNKGIEHICNPDKEKYLKDRWESYAKTRIANVCHGRRMFSCGAGLRADGAKVYANFGLCPRETRVGDFVVLFAGAKTPHVIRMLDEKDENGKHAFGLVGEAYVHSWVRGQVGRGMRGDEELFVIPLR